MFCMPSGETKTYCNHIFDLLNDPCETKYQGDRVRVRVTANFKTIHPIVIRTHHLSTMNFLRFCANPSSDYGDIDNVDQNGRLINSHTNIAIHKNWPMT